MSFKPGQWVVVDTSVVYWPAYSKEKKGPFKISHIDQGTKGKFAILEKAPNNAYFKELTLYTPQVGDKVKILEVMSGMQAGGPYGAIGTITSIHLEEEPSLSIDGWFYPYKEGKTFELVEPKGSINVAAQAPDAVKPQPTKRVLNA